MLSNRSSSSEHSPERLHKTLGAKIYRRSLCSTPFGSITSLSHGFVQLLLYERYCIAPHPTVPSAQYLRCCVSDYDRMARESCVGEELHAAIEPLFFTTNERSSTVLSSSYCELIRWYAYHNSTELHLPSSLRTEGFGVSCPVCQAF